MSNETGLGVSVHGTAVAVAVDADGPLVGTIFLGESGAGKSMTALQALAACPFYRSKLIADDAIIVRESDGHLFAECPQQISGAIEMAGSGILHADYVSPVRLQFAIDLAPMDERLPIEHVWSPFGNHAPGIPVLHLRRSEPLYIFLRSLLTGHSIAGNFDSVPAR